MNGELFLSHSRSRGMNEPHFGLLQRDADGLTSIGILAK